MRKPFISLVVLFLMASAGLRAQQTTVVEEYEDEADMHLKVGALAGLTLSMNTTDYVVQRVTRSLGVGSHFGVRASIPIGKKTRVVTGLGYHTLTFEDENKYVSVNDQGEQHRITLLNDGTLKTQGTFQYTVLTAMLQFSAVFIGVNLGFPAAAEMTNTAEGFEIPPGGVDPTTWPGYGNVNNPENRKIKEDITPADEDINTLIELRLGGEFPIVKSPVGDLNLGISVGYTFQNIIKDSRDNLPHMETNFWLPNVLFHLSYMFNL